MPDHRQSLLRFALKDLLVSMTSIGLAMGCLVFGLRSHESFQATFPWLGGLLWFAIGLLFGVGLFAPFKRPGLGAVCGLIVQAILLAILIVAGEA